ncbi:MAG: hypothetical protein JWO27_1223 [Frankiales bacterium]|nr:hypothetical protein [Frankiales bacterium]
MVALGGGHGLAASLQALRQVTDDLTAIVTVADDGGSSGRLRDELAMLPPGDLRMALAALSGEDDWSQTWSRLLQHRFGGDGPLAGHAVGNLMLAGLAETTGMVEALDLVGRLVGARGRVLPASTTPLQIVAEVVGLDPTDRSAITEVIGQVAVATTTGDVCAVRLLPEDPPACPEAVQAVLDADFVVLGPGSWLTSVITHLLIPELREALAKTAATRVVALNLAPQPGETEGYSPETHLEVLCAHAPELLVDVVVADEDRVLDRHGLMSAVESAGGRLVLAPVALGDGTPRHDPQLLAAVYSEIVANS